MIKFLDVSFANDFSSFVTNSPVKKSVEFKINLDFHFLCKSGNFKIAEVMIDKSLELNIKLNPNQGGLFGRSTWWGVGWNVPAGLFELFQPHFSFKSTQTPSQMKAGIFICR